MLKRYLPRLVHRLTGYRSRSFQENHQVQYVIFSRERAPSLSTRLRRTAMYSTVGVCLSYLLTSPIEQDVDASKPESTPKQQEGDVGAKSAEVLPTAKVPDGQEAVVSQPAAAITGETRSYFIPLTPVRKFEQPLYGAENPDIMSIMMLFNNPKQQTKLKKALSRDIGLQLLKGNHRHIQALGQPLQVDQYWFEFDWPIRPPPIYVLSGIEIIGSDIYWSRKEIAPDKVSRIEQAMWPKALFRSAVTGFQTLLHLNEQRVRSHLAKEGGKDGRTEEQDQKREGGPGTKQQAAKAHIRAKPGPDKQTVPSASTTGPSSPPSSSSSSSSSSSPSSSIPPPPASASADEAMSADFDVGGAPPSSATTTKESPEKAERSNGSRESVKALQQDIKLALSIAKRHLAYSWIGPTGPRPADAIEVNGEMQLAGPHGTLTMVVRGFYHPAKGQWGRVDVTIRPPKLIVMGGGSNESQP